MDNTLIIIDGPMNPAREGVGRALTQTYEVVIADMFDDLLLMIDNATSDFDQD